MEEIEAKFLNINPKDMRGKLRELGAERLWRRKFRRKLYDSEDLKMDSHGAWVRLRDEVEQVTLTYKQRLGVKKERLANDDGMEEIEVVVSDFDKTAMILEKAGLVLKRYVENFRERWILEGIEIDLDEYPLIPPYMEIESKSWEQIDQMILKLGLDPKDKKIFSGKQIYEFWGINESEFSVLTFEKQVKKKS